MENNNESFFKIIGSFIKLEKCNLYKNKNNKIKQSLGNLLGSGLLILALIYMASRFNWDKLAINYVENFMGQINWTKIIPSPTKLFSLPSLGQP